MKQACIAFDLPESKTVYATERPYLPWLTYEDMRHWSVADKCVWLSEDIQRNAHLTEFATMCIAAGVKNKHISKSILNFYAGATALAFIFICPLFWSYPELVNRKKPNSESLYDIIALTASLTFFIYFATSNTIPKVLDNAICNYYDTRAFTLACQKLAEQNNFKPLATYYAFAKLVDHRPLSQGMQLSIIEWVLKNNGCTIASALTSDSSTNVLILKTGTSIANGTYSIPQKAKPEVNLADFNTSAKLNTPRLNA